MKTYVGTDGKLHFVNSAGADTALNFSSGFSNIRKENMKVLTTYSSGSSSYFTCEFDFTKKAVFYGRMQYNNQARRLYILASYDPDTGVITAIDSDCGNASKQTETSMWIGVGTLGTTPMGGYIFYLE